jgi:hypothetical protein
MENPYAPPTADLGDVAPPPAFDGRPLPWEEVPTPEGALGATLRLFLQDTHAAGEGLGASEQLGRPLLWYLLLGFLPVLALAVLGMLHPIRPVWMAWMGLPVPQPATGALLVIGLVSGLFFGAIGAAISLAVLGLLFHACLWMMGGTQAKKGLLVTFRVVIYVTGVVTLIRLPFALLQYLPGLAGQVAQGLVLVVTIVTYSYHGLMLARAHRTEGWRGVAAAWIPALAVLLCCGGVFFALWHFGGQDFQDALRHGMRGGR